MPSTPVPSWQCSPWPLPRIVVLVIILAFVVVMTADGCPPAMALGLAAAALTAAGACSPAKAALEEPGN
jgi:hypothetical protein